MHFRGKQFGRLLQMGLWALCAIVATAKSVVAQDSPPLQVAATLPLIGEWVKAVGGDAVQVRVLAPAGSDPHSFEPSARGIAAARSAQAVFALGLGLEPWLDKIERADTSLRIFRIAPTSGLRILQNGESCEHDHAHTAAVDPHAAHTTEVDPHDAVVDPHTARAAEVDPHATHSSGVDPHVWLDPLLVKGMVMAIANRLSQLEPERADVFANNASNYCAELDALDTQIREALAAVSPSRRKLVTNHDSLHYFADRYGFVVVGTLFGTQGAEGGQPSARKVREMVARLKSEGIEAIFADATSNQNLFRAVAKEAGIAAPVSLYPMPGDKNSPAPDYLSMMRYNAAAIAKALGGDGSPRQ